MSLPPVLDEKLSEALAEAPHIPYTRHDARLASRAREVKPPTFPVASTVSWMKGVATWPRAQWLRLGRTG